MLGWGARPRRDWNCKIRNGMERRWRQERREAKGTEEKGTGSVIRKTRLRFVCKITTTAWYTSVL